MIKEKILIIDDETGIRSSLRGILEDEGYIVKTADSGEQGLAFLRGENFDALLLDVWLPEMSGIEVLERVKAAEESMQVIMITGHGSIETAVKATKLGALDFLEKPLSLNKVVLTVKNALKQKKLEEENLQLRERFTAQDQLIGDSPPVRKLKAQIKSAAPTKGRVLIHGENGTGKKLIAQLIHKNSPRQNKRFVQVNSTAIPEDLLESQLFGFVQGGGPGAEMDRKGKILLADGGTLFIDEVGDLGGRTQSKLVRFIDDRSFEPLGSNDPIESDVRLIVATNQNLRTQIENGKFSEDLFFKLSVIPMYAPPLRERIEDIPLLITHYLTVFSKEYGCPPKRMSQEALDAFKNYSWPGNISELINVIERFVIMVREDEIRGSHLSLLVEPRESQFHPESNGFDTFEKARSKFEREYIHGVLIRHNWDLVRASEELRLDQDRLQEMVKCLGISFLD